MALADLIFSDSFAKGQLFLKCPFDVFILTTKLMKRIFALASKEKSNKNL